MKLLTFSKSSLFLLAGGGLVIFALMAQSIQPFPGWSWPNSSGNTASSDTVLLAESASADFPGLTPEEVGTATKWATGYFALTVAESVANQCRQDPSMNQYLSFVIRADINHLKTGSVSIWTKELGQLSAQLKNLQANCLPDAAGFFVAVANLTRNWLNNLSPDRLAQLKPEEILGIAKTMAKMILAAQSP